MTRSRTRAALAAAWLLAACAGTKSPEDRSAHRQAAATLPASAASTAALAVTSGAVACDGGEIYVANDAGNRITVHDRTATGDQPPCASSRATPPASRPPTLRTARTRSCSTRRTTSSSP